MAWSGRWRRSHERHVLPIRCAGRWWWNTGGLDQLQIKCTKRREPKQWEPQKRAPCSLPENAVPQCYSRFIDFSHLNLGQLVAVPTAQNKRTPIIMSVLNFIKTLDFLSLKRTLKSHQRVPSTTLWHYHTTPRKSPNTPLIPSHPGAGSGLTKVARAAPPVLTRLPAAAMAERAPAAAPGRVGHWTVTRNRSFKGSLQGKCWKKKRKPKDFLAHQN